MELLSLLISLFVIYTGADFITGLFHWFEDCYLDSSTSRLPFFFDNIAKWNELHHHVWLSTLFFSLFLSFSLFFSLFLSFSLFIFIKIIPL